MIVINAVLSNKAVNIKKKKYIYIYTYIEWEKIKMLDKIKICAQHANGVLVS